MPYKTKAERERERWMTLPEAVAHICSADGCDERDARRQLIAALVDNVLGPLKWERERSDKPAPFGVSSIISTTDTPPLGREWLKAKICWKTGRVRDHWRGKWRVLLILRHGIARHWKPSPPSRLSSTSIAPPKRQTGPKTQKKSLIIGAMKEDLEAKRLSIDDLRNMPDKALSSRYGAKFDAKRTSCREARKQVVTEFAGNSNSVKLRPNSVK